MDKHNPYAPSAASLAGAAVNPTDSGGTWRDGKILVLSREASLPPRCVKCNEPADEPTKMRKVYWHTPWLYVLALLNLILYAIVVAIVRKKATVAPGLCSTHKKRRRMGIAAGWTLLIAGFALIGIGIADQQSVVIPGGILMVLAAVLVSAIATRILRPNRIDAQYVRLRGCGPEFLDSIPPFVG